MNSELLIVTLTASQWLLLIKALERVPDKRDLPTEVTVSLCNQIKRQLPKGSTTP